MIFVIFEASSKYGNTKPAFSKDYGFPYHWTPKILKEIFAKSEYILVKFKWWQIVVTSELYIKIHNFLTLLYNYNLNTLTKL